MTAFNEHLAECIWTYFVGKLRVVNFVRVDIIRFVNMKQWAVFLNISK